jgi:C-terminal peptidase prc
MRLSISFWAFVWSVLTFESAFGTQKPLADYWKDVGLSFSSVENILTDSECSSGEKEFVACVNGVNAALSFDSKKRFVLVAAERLTPDSGYGPIEKDFGRLKLVRAKAPVELDSVAKVEAFKKDRAENIEALRQVFRTNPHIDFEGVVAWITNEIVKESSNESYLTAETLNAILAVENDPHTRLMPTRYFEDDMGSNSETLVGIGVHIVRVNKKIVILKPFDGGSGLAAGLRAKDIILAVDGQNIGDLPLNEVVAKIRGEEGSSVRLRVKRKEKTLDFTIVRKQIQIKNVSEKIVSDMKIPVGYVKLNEFKTDSCVEVKASVLSLLNRRPKGLVLDLRENGGGKLDMAVCISSLFVGPNKVIVIQKPISSRSADIPFEGSEPQLTDLPLIVLINSRSASASEIVSGALQHYERAILVGDRSFGKGSVQKVRDVTWFHLPAGVLKLAITTARFYITESQTNQLRGILPNLYAYASPNPTDEDLVALREEDLYPNFLPAEGEPWVETRPALMKSLKDCVETRGRSRAFFEAHQDDAIPPDYQLLYAEDVLKCELQKLN